MKVVGPVVRHRLSDQAAAHWREFSVIIAGGSTAIAIGAAGLLIAQPVEGEARALVGGMLATSVIAFVLAYFSIQAGSLVLVGRLTLWEVLASFAIAAPQVAMPLWLGSVLRRYPEIDNVDDVVVDSMHWFGLLACFAAAASFANFNEFLRRDRAGLRAPDEFESAQFSDRLGAFVNALVLLGVWLKREDIAWELAVAFVCAQAAILTWVLVNQSMAIRRLAKAVESSMRSSDNRPHPPGART